VRFNEAELGRDVGQTGHSGTDRVLCASIRFLLNSRWVLDALSKTPVAIKTGGDYFPADLPGLAKRLTAKIDAQDLQVLAGAGGWA
jgi:hypothetical protein